VIFHPKMMPRVVICDPELTVGMPPFITTGTGMDALAHCLEAYCAPSYHPIAEGIAVEGMRLVFQNLPKAVANGKDLEARAHMMSAAAMGAAAFQKGLGAIHALSHPVGALYHTHHGMTNGVFMPYVLVFNRPAIEEKIVRLAGFLGIDGGFDGFLKAVLALRKHGVPHDLTGLKVDGSKVQIHRRDGDRRSDRRRQSDSPDRSEGKLFTPCSRGDVTLAPPGRPAARRYWPLGKAALILVDAAGAREEIAAEADPDVDEGSASGRSPRSSRLQPDWLQELVFDLLWRDRAIRVWRKKSLGHADALVKFAGHGKILRWVEARAGPCTRYSWIRRFLLGMMSRISRMTRSGTQGLVPMGQSSGQPSSYCGHSPCSRKAGRCDPSHCPSFRARPSSRQ
jgi:hypothetical protein